MLRGGPHQRRQVDRRLARRELPDVPAVRQRDVGARHDDRAVTGEVGVEPVLFALEAGRRDVRKVFWACRPRCAGEQRADVQIVTVDVELRHRRDHRLDLVLLAGQRRDQLRVMQSRRRGGQPHLHQRHRVRRQFHEGGVPAVHGVANPVGEVHAVAQALLPVLHVVDRVAARLDVGALVHRREDAGGGAHRLDALQLRAQLTQQRVHLRGVAGTLRLELAGELALRLGARDDRVHLLGRAADDGLGGCGVDAHLEIGEVGEHRLDLVGGVLHQRHQPDVLTEQHRLTLTHQVRARADRPGGVAQRQTAGEIGRRGLTQRLTHHRSGFGAVMLEQLTQRDLDREDGDLRGLDAVVLGVVQDQLEHRIAQLVLHQGIDLLDPLGENRVAQIQVLAHLAVLGTESGEHPHRAVGHWPVDAEHVGPLFALGHRAQTLDGLLVVVGQHHRARPAVVAPRQRPPDRLQRRRLALRALHPVRQLGGGGLLTRGQERRYGERNERLGRLGFLLGRKLFQCGRLEAQRLLGETGQLRLDLVDREIVGDDVAEVIEPQRMTLERGRFGLLGLRGRPGVGRRLRRALDDVTGQHLAHHQVRVGATEAEAGHAGQRVATVARPIGRGLNDFQVHAVEVDVGAGSGEVERRGQLVVLQGQHHLGQAGRAGGRLQMAHIGFHRTQQHRPVGGTAATDDAAQRLGLDRVAEHGSGAVRLDVVDVARIDAGVLVGAAQHLGLSVLVGGDQAVGAAVVVDRAARDDGQDLVAVPAGVGDPFEHEHAAALGAGVAVGILRERLDPAVGRQHGADLVESERRQRGEERVDAAGEGHVAFAVAQRLHRLVRRHQGAGARGVQRHRGAAEVVKVGHPVGDDRVRGAGDGVRVRDGRVGHRQELIVVVGESDVHTDGLTAQARRGDAGVFERLPGQLEGHPLLRVDVVGFGLSDREELRVEALDVFQVATAGAGLGNQLGDPRLFEEFRPAAFGQVGDGVAALHQRLPGFARAVHVPGQPGGQPDDRDVDALGRAGAGPVDAVEAAGIPVGAFGFALDNAGRQRLDGRVLERHGNRQRDAGQVLDVGGHGHRVARRQAQLDHGNGLVDRVGGLADGPAHPVAQPCPHLGDGGDAWLLGRHLAGLPVGSRGGVDGVFGQVRFCVSHGSWIQSVALAKAVGDPTPLRRLPSR